VETNRLSFGPVTDDLTLVGNPEGKRRAGQLYRFPMMIGSNFQEGRVFQRNQNNVQEYLQKTFPGNVTQQEAIRAAYPIGKNGLNSGYDVISQIMSDYTFGCPAYVLSDDSARGGYPTWRYYFNATFPNLQKFPNAGVYHSSEIELVFGTYGTLNTDVSKRLSNPSERQVSEFMQGSWARFARDPESGPSSPGWNLVGTAHTDTAVLRPQGVAFLRPNEVIPTCSLFGLSSGMAGHQMR
jgi:carboxylesterase type B